MDHSVWSGLGNDLPNSQVSPNFCCSDAKLTIDSNLVVISITYAPIAPLVLGFATIGLYFFYFAFRYNLLFVNVGKVDTKGLVYPRALQHILTGCYLSMICLIGLFGIQAAPGPLVLMVVFLIFCVIYHISMYRSLSPLFHYLPRSLEAEEESLLHAEESALSQEQSAAEGKNGLNGSDAVEHSGKGPLPPAPHKKPNMFAKFFRPDLYTDYATMRRLVPRDFGSIEYSEEIQREAYLHPALADRPPLLWVPRDEGGVSRQECQHTSRVIPMTDEGAYFDEKGKMVVVKDHQAPIFQEKIYY